MRISSLQIFNIANKSMADVNREMVKTQEQMSTGRRVLTPADDPVAATKILALTDELATITQYKKNIDIAENNLALEESILGGVTNVIQRMQELAVAAGNTASLSENEYRAMAVEVEERLDELLNLLNSKNASGDFIFGGYKSKTAPFEGSPINGYRYLGDGGSQQIKISSNTTVDSTDSGKDLFMDIASVNNTIHTSASSGNRSNPPASINIGEIVDQQAFDDFYPEDMVVTFNPDSNLVPPSKNITITERSTGRIIAENMAYTGGEAIEVNGVRFRISGSPLSGVAAVPAELNFGELTAPAGYNFGALGSETFTLTVGKHTETLVLDADITNVNDLEAVLNDATNGNAQKLARLGITVSNQGFEMPQGANFSIASGTANIDAVMGFNTAVATTTTDGVKQQAGDRFFIESSEKQGILTTLGRFKEAMQNYDGGSDSKATIAEVVASTLGNLAHAQTSVLDVVSKIGARINTLDSTRELHLDTELVSNEIMAELRDVDYAEAATRLSAQTLILQAAQQSFIRVSQLNLFSRL